jgi:polyol permease family
MSEYLVNETAPGGVVKDHQHETFLGIPRNLLLRYLAIIVFMVGDGLESGWLSPYIMKLGFTEQQAALIFTMYGVTLAIASWFSGTLAGIWGPRRTMLTGFVIWIVFDIGFITLGVMPHNYPFMMLMYSLRGLGYPLFAYGFLVWITYVTPANRLGTAVGWFWFFFVGGLLVLGPYYSSFTLPRIGSIATLWTALAWVVVGGILGVALTQGRPTRVAKISETTVDNKKNVTRVSLLRDASIVIHNPKIAIGGIVRIIDSTSSCGLLVSFPIYFTSRSVGFTLTQWLQLLGAMFLSNGIWNLLWGILGDRLGWRNTVLWFGGVGCALSLLLVYYVPTLLGPNYLFTLGAMICYGIMLAAYTPLSALMPSMAPENKGGAMAILNLGAGLAWFVGPALVAIFEPSIQIVGLIWLFAILHVIGAIMTHFLKLPEEIKQKARAIVPASPVNTSIR